MMRLLRVELVRFRSRRLNLLAVLGILAVAAVVVFGAWRTSVPPSAAEIAQVQDDYDRYVADWEENGEQYLADCLAGEEEAQEINPGEAWGCENQGPGSVEDWIYTPPTFAENAPRVLPGFGLVLVFAAFLMGVSFIAAEFSSGAISNWLTFEPRRTRVYASKVAAAGLALLPVAVLASAVVLAGTWAAYSLNDHLGTMTAQIWGEVGQSGLRLALLAVGFAMLGVAVGTVVRSTAAAVGILVGYAIVVEGIVGGLVEDLRPRLLQLNLQAALDGGARYWVDSCEGQICEGVEKTVSLTSGAVTLTVVLAVVVLAAAAVFRRRDVA